jgi:Amidohydrolase
VATGQEARSLAQPPPGHVQRDAAEPGAEPLGRAQPAQIGHRRDRRLLRGVAGQLWGLQDPCGQEHGGVPVPGQQLGERPGLRLAFTHGAGGMPLMLPRAHYFWAGTWNEEPPTPERAEAPGRAGCSPIEYARRYWYDTCVFDRRALRYLIDILGPDRLLIGTDFPAMPREDPCGKTLLSVSLPGRVVQDITWYNCFRFLGKDPPDEPPCPHTSPRRTPTSDI